MVYAVNADECIACGACVPVCAVEAISEMDDGKAVIEASKCNDCGDCADVCPVECIKQQ
ncbi:indolepyruvate ferredoxin oxidoreductase subunit alpha [Methanococcus voltae]|uniref:Ferredoxin n=2 Tax=Methanococcus voltae TaxID=2188 RepID=A0A8J7RG96_METVO|nr:4Fe-4S binding protein [Methanococcus voltae]MBP2172751.1 ferredoxin [Methanococcus voltae]MBP2201839.1 ferredoxin [Methanococcus voltae]MCS3922663.1 ferredoxin [Methanococcus voltae PS]